MVPMLTSRLLSTVENVRHGFTTREGGVSTGPYASMNLGLSQAKDDAPGAVDENYRRLCASLGARRAVNVKQVHGNTVVPVEKAGRDVEADGITSASVGDAAVVLVADCAPVLLARRDGTMVAAVHAGWRGAVNRIASRAVELLGTMDLVAAVGPCIGPCCFEVGPEVAEAASRIAGSSVVIPKAAGNPHVDLPGIVAADLEGAGVPRDQVDILRACTRCGAQFFSHRRDQGITGRQAGVIGRMR